MKKSGKYLEIRQKCCIFAADFKELYNWSFKKPKIASHENEGYAKIVYWISNSARILQE